MKQIEVTVTTKKTKVNSENVDWIKFCSKVRIPITGVEIIQFGSTPEQSFKRIIHSLILEMNMNELPMH